MTRPEMQLVQVGKYRILQKLGQGAMGEVFRAHDPVLGRDVAIKILTEKLSGDETARMRFQREARSAAQLNHPNIVTVHDFGDEQGTAYMAMELLEGTDLRELIETRRIRALADKLAIMEQVLDGLAFAHAKGVFHRDLKPGNIQVLPNGQIKIMDFGLARRAQDAAATGVVMGTPYYMAPEQAEGERPTARTDIFSVGALFYELLSGKRPFTGPTIPAVLLAVVRRDPEPLSRAAPEVTPALAAVIMRALAKEPAARYADAGEMREALSAAMAAEGPEMPSRAPQPTTDDSPPRPLGPPLSARQDTSAELMSALGEIEQYLADRVPPLMVADSVASVMRVPTEALAAEIWVWATRQQMADPGAIPLVDLLFHAVHKLCVIGELDLVDKETLVAFLRRVGEEIAVACEPGDRDRLRRALLHLGESEMVRTDPIDVVRRVTEPLASAATPGLRRLSLLEQRLRRGVPASATPTAQAVYRRVASQAITAAAIEAKNERELEDHLRRLRRSGVASGADEVFRSLGQELAEWALPKELAPDTAEMGEPGEVKAMRQIVSLPDDPIEVARRYRHLVTSATEQFNQGNLGGAVQMFELASRLAVDKKVAHGYIEPLQKKGHEALDTGRLRHYLERAERRPQLQAILQFFGPGFAPATLLDELEGEERRDRRRLLLDLLLVHGQPARALARTRLLDSLRTPAPDFARRNWTYLLRLVPRPADEPIEPEIDAVCRFAGPGSASFLVKEALLYLGQTRHPRAAQGLVGLLRAWEQHLEGAADDLVSEGQAALDRLAGALARQGGGRAWGALLEHARSRRPVLGATMARLAELGTQDLSSCPEIVETISTEIRDVLSRGVLGRLVGRKDQDLPSLVAALAGTRTPAVRSLLAEVADRYDSQEIGRVATRAMTPPSTPAVASISGELDAFGLPAVLQRLMEARSSGTLGLMPREGAGMPAAIGLSQGRVTSARWGHREAAEAFYQLFERPFTGKYAFDPTVVPTGTVMGELATLVREGVRRARELRRTSAVVPADLPLAPTGAAPATVLDEADYELVVALWQKACAGVPPERLEAELNVDAFRIFRPLAQWLEEGALHVAAPAEAPATPEPAPGT